MNNVRRCPNPATNHLRNMTTEEKCTLILQKLIELCNSGNEFPTEEGLSEEEFDKAFSQYDPTRQKIGFGGDGGGYTMTIYARDTHYHTHGKGTFEGMVDSILESVEYELEKIKKI